jgi:hypothetical protein
MFFWWKSTSTKCEANLQSTINICINLQALIVRLIRLETDDLSYNHLHHILPFNGHIWLWKLYTLFSFKCWMEIITIFVGRNLEILREGLIKKNILFMEFSIMGWPPPPVLEKKHVFDAWLSTRDFWIPLKYFKLVERPAHTLYTVVQPCTTLNTVAKQL